MLVKFQFPSMDFCDWSNPTGTATFLIFMCFTCCSKLSKFYLIIGATKVNLARNIKKESAK